MQYQPPTGNLPQPNVPPPIPLVNFRPPSRMPWVLTAAVVAVAGFGAYWGLGERARLTAKAQEAKSAVRAAVAAGQSLEKQLSELQSEKETLEADQAALIATRDNLAKSVEEKSGELAALKDTTDKLKDKMKDEIAKGDIQLTESGGKLRVGLVDKILFDSGEASISKRGEGVLARVGAVLASIEDRHIQVSGHTDNAPISDKLKHQYPPTGSCQWRAQPTSCAFCRRRPRCRPIAWWPAATANTSPSPATTPPPAAPKTVASISCSRPRWRPSGSPKLRSKIGTRRRRRTPAQPRTASGSTELPRQIVKDRPARK